jgi:DNA-directed RNA polymerase subunit K/omega
LAENQNQEYVRFEGDGPYMTVNIIARRAREINKERMGSRFYDEDIPDPMDVANNEETNGLLEWEFRSHLVGTGDDFRSV